MIISGCSMADGWLVDAERRAVVVWSKPSGTHGRCRVVCTMRSIGQGDNLARVAMHRN